MQRKWAFLVTTAVGLLSTTAGAHELWIQTRPGEGSPRRGRPVGRRRLPHW